MYILFCIIIVYHSNYPGRNWHFQDLIKFSRKKVNDVQLTWTSLPLCTGWVSPNVLELNSWKYWVRCSVKTNQVLPCDTRGDSRIAAVRIACRSVCKQLTALHRARVELYCFPIGGPSNRFVYTFHPLPLVHCLSQSVPIYRYPFMPGIAQAPRYQTALRNGALKH